MNNNPLTDEDVLSLARRERIEIIGLSIKTATVGEARRLAFRLRELPDVCIVAGGPHVSIAADELILESWLDYVFIGEAEVSLPRFCEDRSVAESGDCPGVWSKQGHYMEPLLTDDLDTLPFPDYTVFSGSVVTAVRECYPIVTSRGCAYDCIYCSVPWISGKRFRKRHPDALIEELEFARNKYDIRSFCIIDDAFNLDVHRAKRFCNLLIDRKTNLPWSCPNGLRADRVDDELAELMFRAGCREVMVGIETADPNVLKLVKKGETLEDIRKGIRIFQSAGISVGGYFIIGLPGDSFRSQKQSVQFVQEMGISAHFNMLIPYPGTQLWDWVRMHANILVDIEKGLHFADSPDKVAPVFETADYKVQDRLRAYEMVYTRLSRFDMIIPSSETGWHYYVRAIVFMLKYDPIQLWRRASRFLLNIATKYQ
jgi:radical SAM superfamily enzyme YgiQ (UPF0313 family)